ncbi:MAG: SMP-30/gluconolactonase/LRE family protein [Pirellulales bacterium]
MTSPQTTTLHRRRFLTTSAAGLAYLSLPQRRACAAVSYEGLKSDDYLGPAMIETRIEGDDVFTEGPAVDRQGIVYFTNIPPSHILRWDPKKKERSVFRENSNKTNGLLFDPEGRLLACEGGAGRVTRTDMQTGEIEVLADTYNGRPLAPPNDLCLDSKGRLYFSSRPGLGDDPEQDNVNAVYRRDPDGSLHRLLHWPNLHMPNGLVIAPDEKTLYLIEAHAEADHHRDVRAYDLADDGSLSNERVLIDFYPGRSGDGMCIDAEGNLYIAAGLHKTRGSSETLDTRPGIHVVSPQGKLLAYRETPQDTVTNCTFGGSDLRTLYITSGPLLLSLRTQIPGKPSYRPSGRV